MPSRDQSPPGPHERRSGRSGGKPKPLSVLTKGWIVAVTVMAAGLLAATIGFWMTTQIKGKDKGTVRVNDFRAEGLEGMAGSALRLDPEEALSIARQAVGVRSESGVEARIHMGDATAAVVLEFLAGLSASAPSAGDFELLHTVDANGLRMQNVLFSYRDKDGKDNSRLVVLTPDQEDVWKMDFGAFARLTEPSWEAFLAGEADSIVARVFIGRDTYYNRAFSDERRWACYAVASPDVSDLLLGYCEHRSPAARALAHILASGERGMVARATVELRRVDDTESRQLELTRVIAEDWVIREPDFDERFN